MSQSVGRTGSPRRIEKTVSLRVKVDMECRCLKVDIWRYQIYKRSGDSGGSSTRGFRVDTSSKSSRLRTLSGLVLKLKLYFSFVLVGRVWTEGRVRGTGPFIQ